MSGRRKAFETTWIELKNAGYLKVYMRPSVHGRDWCVQYDLLPDADIADGVHTYYYNREGMLTATNISKKEYRNSATQVDHPPCDRTPQNGIYGHGQCDTGNNDKGGNKIILDNNINYNTNSNTYNQSIYHTQDGLMEEDVLDEVINELRTTGKIPYEYASNRNKMSAAIHYLTEWEFRQTNPFHTSNGEIDETKMNAYNLCVDCLIDMACATDLRRYRGSVVSYAKVIDQINSNSNRCSEGGLNYFMESVTNDLLNAYSQYEIRDLKSYTMSLIWNSFFTYKVKQDIDSDFMF